MAKNTLSIKHLEMTEPVYDYLLSNSIKEYRVLKKIRMENQNDHLTKIMQIAPEQAQFMAFLIKVLNVKRVLEIGTSTGYSSTAMALALPSDGVLHTCDVNENATKKAQQYWEEAGVKENVQLHLAPALDTLDSLIADKQNNPFDLAFIDADKIHYDDYFERCLVLLNSNGIIIIDNVLWGGAVADENDNSADTVAIRQLNSKLFNDARIEISMLPIADGLTLVRKR